VLPNLTCNPQESSNAMAGFASSAENFRAVQTMATVSPGFKKGGVIITVLKISIQK
jgi:hypothetical protein